MDFEALYGQCEKSLYYTAINILLNTEDAKDALQETAYQAFKGFGKLRDANLFKTWITRILINNCYKICRKKRKTIENLSLQDIEGIWFDQIDDNEAMLIRALSVLSQKEKEVIILRYVNDLMFKDISSIMKIPLNSIKSIHSRSLLKLKNKLEKENQLYV